MAPRAKPGGKAASAAPAAVPNGKPRRLTPKGEATRARLIGLAAEVFATEGYATVSMRDIATRMGLSIGAIYGSFRSKADLLAEAVDATIASDVETLPASVRELTLPEIDAYQYRHLAKRERARALLLEAAVAARTDPGVRERLRDALVPHIDMATEAHEEWRLSAGVDPALDMRALVTFIWSADLGLGVLAALGVDVPDPTAWSDLVRHLLHGVEAPGAQPGAPTPRPTRRRRSSGTAAGD